MKKCALFKIKAKYAECCILRTRLFDKRKTTIKLSSIKFY